MRLIILLFLILPIICLSQTQNPVADTAVTSLDKKVESLKDKLDKLTTKTIRFGVSIGYRYVAAKNATEYQSPSISTVDSTLRLEAKDRGATVISTSVVMTPFSFSEDWVQKQLKDTRADLAVARGSSSPDRGLIRGIKFKKLGIHFLNVLNNVGIQANINLLDFNNAQEKFAFNKSIEGGMGLCLRLSDKIYFSVHNELFYSRQLRKYFKEQEGHKIYDSGGKLVTSMDQLDPNSDNYYITKSIYGLVYRVIIVF